VRSRLSRAETAQQQTIAPNYQNPTNGYDPTIGIMDHLARNGPKRKPGWGYRGSINWGCSAVKRFGLTLGSPEGATGMAKTVRWR
jgi:hypothetical protein